MAKHNASRALMVRAQEFITFVRRVALAIIGSAILVTMLPLDAAHAATPVDRKARALAPVVVVNDRGGVISQRATEIKRLRETGQPVEIRGEVCLSSCTMFLALPQTCISAKTTFGFHGPSYYGAPLSTSDFEYWSKVLASHYPAPLAQWYMATGRDTINSYHRISGRELIKMGVKECGADA